MADAPHQTPPDSDHEQKKLSLQQKLNTLALLITVVLAILNEQQVSVPDYIWEKRHTAIDAFHPRSGLQPGNIAQGINALAILLAKSNVSVSLYTGISSASTPPSDTVLLAATDVCLPKSSPAFLGKQYIKISRSYGAEAIGGVQVVGQTFSSLLDDMDNLSNYIDRVRHTQDQRAFLPHAGIIMAFVNTLRELHASVTRLSRESSTGSRSKPQASKQPIQLEDLILSGAQQRKSHHESLPDSQQAESVKPTGNVDDQTQQRLGQQFRQLTTKFGLYIVSIFFPAMSRRFRHPCSQRLYNVITSIDSSSVINAFTLYAKDIIRQSPPSHQDIRLLRLLRSATFINFVQTRGLSIRQLHALALAPGNNSLYTPETCYEFHNLLCGLLRGYSDALSFLMAQCNSTTFSSEEFTQKVRDIYTYLQSLWFIAHSNLMATHLATLSPLLRLRLPAPDQPWISEIDALSSMCNGHEPAANDPNCVDLKHCSRCHDLDTNDEDLLSLTRAQGFISPDLLILKWLRIQVVHLAALDIVVGSVATTQRPVSIAFVAYTPCLYQANGMQPWKEAISDLIASASTKDELDVCEAITLLEENYHHCQRFHPQHTATVWRMMSSLMQEEPEPLGRVHASAMLAAWLAYQNLSNPRRNIGFKTSHPPIIGASGMACLVCTELLRSPHRHGIILPPSHPTVRPCAIPPWLSIKAMEEMLKSFSVIMRQLLRIMLSAKRRRQQSPSSLQVTSDNLSVPFSVGPL